MDYPEYKGRKIIVFPLDERIVEISVMQNEKECVFVYPLEKRKKCEFGCNNYFLNFY